jgi:iron complex transport system permease protein
MQAPKPERLSRRTERRAGRVARSTEPPLHLFEVGEPAVTRLFPTRLRLRHLLVGLFFVLLAALGSLLVGPADIAPGDVLAQLASRLPLLGVHSSLSPVAIAVIWQLRMPRIVLGCLVGAMLAVAGASYQGVFHNDLADPYLLGIAAGAGLGATIAVVYLPAVTSWPVDPLPLAAFAGAVLAVTATFVLGRSGRRSRGATSLILGGVAVGAFFTAVQTFLQQQNTPVLAEVYTWILGGLSTAGWNEVTLVLPYIAISCAVLILSRRLLDAMSVGDDEASGFGVRADLVRLLVVAAATLGTAAAVSVSGLIGFVGIIVPHTIRLLAGPSYQRIIPLSVLYGAGFLVLADLLARTVLSPAEVPLGVVTAFLGAPFFLVVLRRSRRLA